MAVAETARFLNQINPRVARSDFGTLAAWQDHEEKT
jgi:hypothetical protein